MADQFEDIYIYVNTNGKLTEIPAFIRKKKPMKLQFAIPAFDRDNNILLEQVAREPGMIFNNTVWFKKKNFKKAKFIFMNDYGKRINTLNTELEIAKNEMSSLSEQDEIKEG